MKKKITINKYYRKGRKVKTHKRRCNYGSFPGGKSRYEEQFRSKEPWTETREQLFILTSPKNKRLNLSAYPRISLTLDKMEGQLKERKKTANIKQWADILKEEERIKELRRRLWWYGY